jgi:endonuclease/exonuclease/phosphatase family metal-dependent hydrolase
MFQYKSKFTINYKRIFFSILFIGFILLCLFIEQDSPNDNGKNDTIRILSFNIRNGAADDGENSWDNRRYLVSEILSNYDIIGLQEALKFQIEEIIEDAPDYGIIGVGRTDGDTLGEYAAVLYKIDRFQALLDGTLWLSDTPLSPGSMNWGNRIPLILTWAKFEDTITGEKFFVFNTYWDHESQDSRIKSARFLRETIGGIANFHNPIIITGDFNTSMNSPEMKIVFSFEGNEEDAELRDSFFDENEKDTPCGTFHGFRGQRLGDKIDYVIVNQMIRTTFAKIIYENDNGRYPSDHFPVMAEIIINTEKNKQ